MKYKPVDEAIVKNTYSSNNNWVLDFQPGNATRYVVFCQLLSGPVAEALCGDSKAVLVAFTNMLNRPSIVLPTLIGQVSLSYLMEKTGLSEGDAVPLQMLINESILPTCRGGAMEQLAAEEDAKAEESVVWYRNQVSG